jgi:glycosyltransferase involved in cell wall biosynthesis
MSKGKLWLDVTDLYHWTGYFTGIQNAVDNLTQLYAADQSQAVGFFVFHPETQAYEALTVEQWHHKRQEVIANLDQPAPADDVAPPLATRVRNKGVRVIKKVTPGFAKRMARQQLTHYRHEKAGSQAATRHPFADGDTVLVIGGNWGDDFIGFAEGLVKIKQQTAIRLLHVVHDFIPVRYPNYFAPSDSYDRYFTKIAQAADGFLCVSQSTASDLADYLQRKGAADTPIKVFRLGEDFREATPIKPNLPLEDDFILCVGTIEGRKNHTLIYYAAKLALQKGIPIPQIIIAGRQGWMADATLRNLTVDPDLQGKVIVSHTIDDDQKAWLFEHCQFSMYPSIYEGWGLPVAESLHNGKYCITSNQSSLPEVGQDYVGYTSPFDSQELLDRIVEAMDPAFRAEREAYIKTRPDFSWQQSFQQFNDQVTTLRDL